MNNMDHVPTLLEIVEVNDLDNLDHGDTRYQIEQPLRCSTQRQNRTVMCRHASSSRLSTVRTWLPSVATFVIKVYIYIYIYSYLYIYIYIDIHLSVLQRVLGTSVEQADV